jgi:hypothetical protein
VGHQLHGEGEGEIGRGVGMDFYVVTAALRKRNEVRWGWGVRVVWGKWWCIAISCCMCYLMYVCIRAGLLASSLNSLELIV